MIVVAIIGILAAIAIPKFADLLRKSNEGATKGNLGSLRSAVTIYYSDTEGWYPTGANALDTNLTTGGKYLEAMPNAFEPPYHGRTRGENDSSGTNPGDSGGWYYMVNRSSNTWGTVRVDCSHTDTRTSTWWSW